MSEPSDLIPSRDERSRTRPRHTDSRGDWPPSALPSTPRSCSSSLWGTPPPLDLDAEADLHTLLALADRNSFASARDISDGGIAVATAQATLRKGIGATDRAGPVADDSSAVRPVCGASLDHAHHRSGPPRRGHRKNRRGTQLLRRPHRHHRRRPPRNLGRRPALHLRVVEELRTPWAAALEATLHGEVLA